MPAMLAHCRAGPSPWRARPHEMWDRSVSVTAPQPPHKPSTDLPRKEEWNPKVLALAPRPLRFVEGAFWRLPAHHVWLVLCGWPCRLPDGWKGGSPRRGAGGAAHRASTRGRAWTERNDRPSTAYWPEELGAANARDNNHTRSTLPITQQEQTPSRAD